MDGDGQEGEGREAPKPDPELHAFLKSLRAMLAVATILSLLALLCGVSSIAISLAKDRAFSSPRGFQGLFFVLGDSYADVGNIPFGAARHSPYGVTWPGHPTGRFSDGRVLPDVLAGRVLGCPSPPAFAELATQSVAKGVNFAVGGAGMTPAYGSPSIPTQVTWLQSLVSAGVFRADALAASVTLISVAGNDYSAFPADSYAEYAVLVEQVVGLIGQTVRDLHGLGLRNVMVSTLAPMQCVPVRTVLSNFTGCVRNKTVEDVIALHDSRLEETLAGLAEELPGVDFLLLRLGDALRRVLGDAAVPFEPCCLGLCGVVSDAGIPLYAVCTHPEQHAAWDAVHPTQAGWEGVVRLYAEDPAFTTFAPTLRDWVVRAARSAPLPRS